jgi:hypothetical protein
LPSLRDLQRSFAEALLAESGAAPAFAAEPPAVAAERFAVYRRAFHANYRNALAASYPVVRRLVGPAFFGAAVDALVRSEPPRSGDLNVYGDGFPRFLDQYPPAGALPYLGDVARLEWAQDEAQRAADVATEPADVIAALAALPAERLPDARLALAPSCRLVDSPFPILRIWQVNQPDADAGSVSLDEGADRLLVRRDPDGIVIVRLPAGEYGWLVAFAGEATLAQALDAARAADPSFEVATALAARIADRTLVAAVAA